MRRAAFITLLACAALPALPLAAAAFDPGALAGLTIGAPASTRAARILAFTHRWLGTPYLWGGTSRTGIDCSAFLREMYRELFTVELPRTTRQQIDLGVDLPVDGRDPSRGLQPGDLIFYVDRTGTPNHVVVFAGNDTIVHSTSGRGVVIDPIRKIFGRRVVARRFLIPRSGASGRDDSAGFAPIPAAGPIIPKEVPCPPSFRADRTELRKYVAKPLPGFDVLGEREICDFRALAEALRAKGGPAAQANAEKLEAHAVWLESLEALKDELQRGW